MYHAECMKERYASVTPMLCLGNGYFMPTIHENRPYTFFDMIQCVSTMVGTLLGTW